MAKYILQYAVRTDSREWRRRGKSDQWFRDLRFEASSDEEAQARATQEWEKLCSKVGRGERIDFGIPPSLIEEPAAPRVIKWEGRLDERNELKKKMHAK